MAVSVAAVMRHCRNFFEGWYLDGTFRISGNALTPVQQAQWICITGSECHDGVWEVIDGYLTGREVDGLWDEEFTGRVWGLTPPPDFLALCQKISEYEEKNPVGALVQESFGEYSYMRSMRAGQSTGWESMFSAALAPFRRMYTEVG